MEVRFGGNTILHLTYIYPVRCSSDKRLSDINFRMNDLSHKITEKVLEFYKIN